MSEGESLPVAGGSPSGVTPDEWRTWVGRGAACILPDGRHCLVTKDAAGQTMLMPVRIVRDRPASENYR